MARLSVVIPAYNEERRLGQSLTKMLAYLKSRRQPFEVIVVDDGSRDATAPLVRRFSAKDKRVRLIMNGGNRGKGASVRRGVEAAKGSLILMSDADLSTPIEELQSLEKVLQDAELAIGSRALDRSSIKKHQPFYREAGGRLFNLLVRLLTLGGIHDTQCGFKLFRAEAAKAIFPMQQVPRFGFDVEILYLARKQGYRIVEVSVAWENSPESKVRPIRDGLRTFLDLALIRWYDFRGRYSTR